MLDPRLSRAGAALAALVLALSPLAGSAGAAEPGAYTLGPMDKLRLRIAEWRTATGDLRDWALLNGDYVVGPGGGVAIPLLGEVEAEGRTTAEVAEAVGEGLQRKFGLTDRPEAALEVTEFRPIYVTGDVKAPGAFPFAPGLTVLKAVSLSGGERRGLDNLRIERDLLQARGERSVFVAERHRLIARRARLDAELAGKAEVAMPPELAEVPERDALLADEVAILRADARRVELQLRSLADLKALLETEIATLGEKRETIERQLALFRGDLEDVGVLANRGLAVNTRVSELQRSVSDLEGRLLDLDTAVLRARQDISEADQDAIAIRNDRAAKLAADRQQADADLAAVELKIRTQDGLVREALALDPAAGGLGEERQVAYTITRAVDGKPASFAARPDSEVRPGDLVEARIELPPASAY